MAIICFIGYTMPIYEYQARDRAKSCAHCAAGFEVIQTLSDPPVAVCPKCGAPVAKRISAPRVHSGYDGRAKAAGFHKLERLGKGEYEKQY